MDKHKTNSNNSSDNLNQNLSLEEINILVRREMDAITTLPLEGELLPDNQRFVQGVLNVYKHITKDGLLRIIIFILLISIYNPYDGLWNSSSGTRDTTRMTSIQNVPASPVEKDDSNTNNTTDKESIVKTEIVHTQIQTLKYLRTISATENTSAHPKNPPALVTALKDIGTLSSTVNRDIINNLAVKIKENSILIHNRKIEIDKDLVQSGNYNSSKLRRLTSPLLFGLHEDNSVSQSEIITIKPFKGKEIKLLSSFINGYLKTNMHIEKDMVVYISSNGIVSTNNCNIEFKPEGWANKQHDTACEPLLDNYNVGALLFRIGNDDNWKPCTAPQTKIIAEKDGVLEFMINLKSSGENLIKGSYVLGVSTGQLTINN